MKGVLFVCTGNIFRSVSAEYALKHHFGQAAPFEIGSAGIVADPAEIAPWVKAHMVKRGLSVESHRQRKIAAPLLAPDILTVAMGENHQRELARVFGVNVPLFNEVCFGRSEGVLDVDEKFPDWRDRKEEAMAYGISVVDYICDSIPSFVIGLRSMRLWQERLGQQ